MTLPIEFWTKFNEIKQDLQIYKFLRTDLQVYLDRLDELLYLLSVIFYFQI